MNKNRRIMCLLILLSGMCFLISFDTQRIECHAYGMAIDINPRINPYVIGGWVSPANGQAYVERDVSKCKGKYCKYMIHKGDVIYKIFKKYGFSWGGEWEDEKDYQHFEKL